MGPKPRPLRERFDAFMSRVDRGAGCWLWPGADNGRYGVIGGHGCSRRLYAHRVSYELANGPVPDGMLVLHRCDMPKCVRPDHLFVGTQAENLADMDRKGRRNVYDRHGARNPRAVVRPEDVAPIRAARAAGETLKSIAARYGIGTSQVHRIASGAAWGSRAAERRE